MSFSWVFLGFVMGWERKKKAEKLKVIMVRSQSAKEGKSGGFSQRYWYVFVLLDLYKIKLVFNGR